jgi:antitoxin component HigA of HigAB toxin-antitoxin module
MSQVATINPAVIEAMAEAREQVPLTVRALLRHFDLSQGDLGLALGLSRQSICNKLTGRGVLRQEEVLGLAQFFGVPTDVLHLDPEIAVKWVIDHPDARPDWLKFPRNR